jgi:hypothetical protein
MRLSPLFVYGKFLRKLRMNTIRIALNKKFALLKVTTKRRYWTKKDWLKLHRREGPTQERELKDKTLN